MGVFGRELHASVARPPVETSHTELLALEHVLSTADNIVDDPPTPFPEYAASLVRRTHWSFWWDWTYVHGSPAIHRTVEGPRQGPGISSHAVRGVRGIQ
ncbi:DUF4253 domain-containing protein [Streptomyces sp. NPDC056190]|uniref:DUF4253 domain-containing protein n=1 Tax=unclassified Streptomyces TaxID=2593676 RepID=UPI0035E144E5